MRRLQYVRGMTEPHDPIARMPVTAVIARRPAPGREAELLAWADDFTAAAAGFDGHTETRVFAPMPPDNEDLVIAMTFDTAEHLAAWERSGMRAALREQARPLVEGRPRAFAASGLEAILGGQPGEAVVPPPRWKTAIVIIIAVYPLTLLSQWLLAPHIGDWPLLLRALPTSLLLPVYVAYVGGPVVSRLLRRWLAR